MVAPPATPAAKTFSGEAAKIQEHLTSVFESARKVNADGADKAPARDKVQKSMDWERVAKDCLGAGEWKKAGAANQKAYKDLLQDVIIRTAYTRVDTFMKGATYTFKDIKVKGKEAQATVIFKQGVDEFTLDYYLSKGAAGWLVYDIAFEEIRYSENIREQIQAFLADKGKAKGFSSLLAKLKERRDKLVEDAASAKKES